MLKILQARLQQYMNRELPDVQGGFSKGKWTRIKLPTSVRSPQNQENSRKTPTSALSTTPKPLTVDHKNLWKNLNEMGIPGYLACILRNLYADQEATVRIGHGTTDWFKIGNEYVKAVYCHPAYLTYMQSTSCEMPGWMKHKLESRMPEEISITSDMQMKPSLWQKVKN